MKIKKDDTVIVITGKDKGKKGKVMLASPKENKVVVQGAAIVTKHEKPKGQSKPGGIVKKEAPIDASNVKIVCPKCSQPTRVGFQIADGKKSRICKKCGQVLDK